MLTALDCAGRRLDLSHTAIMGILNVTPDSFSDGGLFVARDAALRHAELMAQAGADLIDVGGESTRPGANPVSLQQELDRVIPVVEMLSDRIDLPVSIDTSKPEVMTAAVAAGAGLINDVYALRQTGALAAAAAAGVPVCLMHMQGQPRTMQTDPRYGDVVTEVVDFLAGRAQACIDAGIKRDGILLDPGYGFGKTLTHNLALVRGLEALVELGFPVLVGLSRKSMIEKLLGTPIPERDAASVALALIAAAKGARIVRVHDVRSTRDALRCWEAVYNDPAPKS